eukprot:CAMPEP_0194212150 /NCGR_PEP_ID=MMETSP0156-20130528/11833_1 /TAXON_ID=33649 /ORGANISM="Thalassionema nitzschioides, Strain L26-B" /LENGTH=151 /DNA_ID=CAMNT_0038939897 /DNA_START=66 /DNA_END=521 /DNA_ORIENTATION=+
MNYNYCHCFLLLVLSYSSSALQTTLMSRRSLLASSSAAAIVGIAANQPASARYVLNEETGDYDEVEDETWQEAWKSRWDKAQTMSTDDVFMAARGAGNTDLKAEGEESLSSKKRRAMAACRDEKRLAESGVQDQKECTGRVLKGEVDFMLK